MNELALFAGAGGGILGGKLVGWRTVCAVEWNPFAAGLLAARQNEGALPPFPIWDDVRTFDGRPWRGTVDVVSGGFPCQDISAAGKGKGLDGERSGMWREMARIVGEVGPEWVFVENSPMLTVRGLGTVLADLAALGFDAQWGVLGAAELGAKHRRERIWIAAHSQLHGRDGRTLRGRAGASEDERRLLKLEGLAAWGSEPDVARVVDGVATPLDKARVKALGNGQVPQVAAAAWRLLTAGKSNTHNDEVEPPRAAGEQR
jgi:DNA (cytosine-5)-methyltransferase 1